ncbi:hypothetical protein DFH06DRAFT_1148393 [Mycena polygramma]|nr:hypothetical protein DFH06DRAFT_1148393 [Mycena polygramma]
MLPFLPRRILTDCRFFGLVLLALHPTFSDIREYERRLPQHQTPFRQGSPPRRYLCFSWEGWGSGWNNVFREQLLNTHLAYLAHRGYIFVDYTPRDHPPFPDTVPNGTRHLLHIPMNAFTSGPTGGGSLGPNTDAIPRAASLEWWKLVCPTKDVVEVDIVATAKELNISNATSGHDRLLGWASKLRDIDAPCVNVVGGSPFDYLCVSHFPFLLDYSYHHLQVHQATWPSYGNSPVLKEFAWSSLITRTFARNYALFSPSSAPSNIAPTPWAWILGAVTTGSASTPYPLSAFRPYRASSPAILGLLGIHVRPGDYEQHCRNLADWGSDYNAWNLFGRPDIHATVPSYPQFPDHLTVPRDKREVRVARRARGAVARRRMGDGEDEFAVAQAVDSAVLMSAETLIGVGLRLAGGRHPATNRFW